METIAQNLQEMQRTPLAPSHVAALRQNGEVITLEQGEMVAEVGAPANRFIYLLSGEIEVINPWTGERALPSTLGAGQFMAEIAILAGGNWSLPLRGTNI